MYDKNKLTKLKNTGLCADAEIEELISAAWIRVSNYISCRVAYRFIYDNKEYRAKSNYYVLSPFKRKEDLYIKVYFNKDNPSQSSVEVFQ